MHGAGQTIVYNTAAQCAVSTRVTLCIEYSSTMVLDYPGTMVPYCRIQLRSACHVVHSRSPFSFPKKWTLDSMPTRNLSRKVEAGKFSNGGHNLKAIEL